MSIPYLFSAWSVSVYEVDCITLAQRLLLECYTTQVHCAFIVLSTDTHSQSRYTVAGEQLYLV
jgi:hypothetical protein